ncbi:DUF6795 domain-containing protein [Shewanella waksmanii]|uniref:DUF6795 domain-containing protein n=1 Tax=Shewanella waksmanii TaxID=213783 RepID=UPI0037359C93
MRKLLSLFSKRTKVEVFPATAGRISLHNQPLKGLRLRRGFYHISAPKEGVWDETTTDINGRFYFQARHIHSVIPSAQLDLESTHQIIEVADSRFIEYQSKYLWSAKSTGRFHQSSFIQRLGMLDGDLNQQQQRHNIHDDNGQILQIESLCDWPMLAIKQQQDLSNVI